MRHAWPIMAPNIRISATTVYFELSMDGSYNHGVECETQAEENRICSVCIGLKKSAKA
jgi:hypothetical protein